MPVPTLTPNIDAPQHGPRPLPLFLEMLRSETAQDAQRRSSALAGLRAYQDAPRRSSHRPKPVSHRHGRACLRDGGGTGRLVAIIPSLINPPFILDLVPGNSLLEFVRDSGFHPYLLDWGEPVPAERDLDVTGHVEQLLLPLLAELPEPPVLVGYCLGGTMALAAACAAPVAGLALVAAPWRFSGFGERAVDEIAELWDAAQPACEALGLVPMEVLQAGFWRLDPARTVAKYERLAGLDAASDAFASFVALEDWANAGAPLTYAAGRQMFDEFFAADLPGRGRWQVAGVTPSPDALPCPAIDFVSLSDRIVPAASAADLPNRRDLGTGHVGMIVGRGARPQLWEPLVHWLNALPAAI